MSLNVAMLEAMKAEGLDLDACIRILRACEPESALEKRRAYDRQRKRDKKAEDISTGNSTGIPPEPSPLKDNIKNPPPETPTNPDGLASPSILNGTKKPEATPDQFIEAWNAMASEAGVHRVGKLTPERRKKIHTLLRRHGIDDITEAIWAVPQSPFCCGQNDRGWKADLEFFLKPATVPKLIEGSYA